MLLALVCQSLVVGAYLVDLTFQGHFDTVAALVAAAVVLIWAARLVRHAVCRRRVTAQRPGGAATAAAP